MKRRGSRWLGAGLLAGAGVAVLELSSLLNPALGSADDTYVDTALIMGYAETPYPLQSYVDQVMSLFIDPPTPLFADQPVFDGFTPVVQPTEEGAIYQFVLTQGVAQLDDGIRAHLSPDGDNDVVVWGYSESSSIATQELFNLSKLDTLPYDPEHLSFVLLEDLNNPNGGFLERFPDLAGTFFPATPTDTPYDVTIYTVQYSGSSDYPDYANNFLAEQNAVAGFVDLHPLLLPGWPTGFDFSSIGNAVLEPVSTADSNTDFYLIPTQNLPIFDLTRALGGNAYADLMQPGMRVLIDLGYKWDGFADVATPADMGSVHLDPDFNAAAVNDYLLAGANQGIIAALVDYGVLDKSDLPDMYPYVPDVANLYQGALFDDVLAHADAVTSAQALVDALTDSDNPLAPLLLTFLPGLADDLAGSFSNYLSLF